MYRYAHTKNRVHRVIVEGGKAFKVEQCNLDDAAFLRLDDIMPEGTHCAYCWVGWVQPTEEEKAKAADEVKSFKESPATESVPIVQSTRRMAAGVLGAALLAGGALGVAASPDQPAAAATDLGPLQSRLDDLFVQIRVLQVDVNGHTHELAPAPSPIVIYLPEASPTPGLPAPVSSQAVINGTNGTNGTGGTTTIIVVPEPTPPPNINPNSGPTPPPPTPTPAPTPAPTVAPTPPPVPVPTCFHPSGNSDPCKFPHQP